MERCSEQQEPRVAACSSICPSTHLPSVHSFLHLSTYLPNCLPTQPPTHLSVRSAGTEAPRPAPGRWTRDGAKTRRGVPPRQQGEARAPSGVLLHLLLEGGPRLSSSFSLVFDGMGEPRDSTGQLTKAGVPPAKDHATPPILVLSGSRVLTLGGPQPRPH